MRKIETEMVNRIIAKDRDNNLTIPGGNTELSLFNNCTGKRCTFFNRIPLADMGEQNSDKRSNNNYDNYRWDVFNHDWITYYKNTGYTTADRIGERIYSRSKKSMYMLLLDLDTNTSPKIGLVYRNFTCTFFNRILREKKYIFQQDFASGTVIRNSKLLLLELWRCEYIWGLKIYTYNRNNM